jgi:hypothetical protein
LFRIRRLSGKKHNRRHHAVQLPMKIGESEKFDNLFFKELFFHNLLKANNLLAGPFFVEIARYILG